MISFAVLTVVGITMTVFWNVTPRSSVKRIHVAKQFYIFIFDSIIQISGDIRVYRLHRVCCSFAFIIAKVFVTVDYCICLEMAIRGQ